VRDSLLHGESEGKTFYEIIEAGAPFGMQTFDQDIIRSFEAGLITEETALAYASHKSLVRRGVDTIKKKQGLVTSDIEELALDEEYGKSPWTRQLS
jgi:twitching motility protein PilT